MNKAARQVMQEAMERAGLKKYEHELEVIRAPKPATSQDVLKLQRHFNKPNNYPYLLQRDVS